MSGAVALLEWQKTSVHHSPSIDAALELAAETSFHCSTQQS